MLEFAGASAYIAVGSNIEPEINIPRALERLDDSAPVKAVSTFYRTPALDRPKDPDFLNGVCIVYWNNSPRALKFNVLRAIERGLGRVRGEDSYAPRAIDLDLLLYGAWVMEEPGLALPDPDIAVRPFLAYPLLELNPALVLPGIGEPLAELAVALDRSMMTPDTAFTDQLRVRLML